MFVASEFWTSSDTLKNLFDGKYFKSSEEEKFEWPPVIKKLLDEGVCSAVGIQIVALPLSLCFSLSADDQLGQSADKKYDLAVSCLGACVWYLKRCRIEHQLLSLQNFEV